MKKAWWCIESKYFESEVDQTLEQKESNKQAIHSFLKTAELNNFYLQVVDFSTS